ILTGGIDLSVGSVMALAGMGAAYAMTIGVPPPFAVLLGIFVGLVVGAAAGALVAYVGIAPFIVTLGMLSFASGLVLGLTKGWPITDVPASLLSIAHGSVLGVPIPLCIAVALSVIGGTSLAGGSGSVLGVHIGACIMGVIKNGLVLMRVSSYWQTAIIGIIIVLAAVLDRAKRRA